MSRQPNVTYKGLTARQIGTIMEKIEKNWDRMTGAMDAWREAQTEELPAMEDAPVLTSKKRGRPAKTAPVMEQEAPKRRGRPRKVVEEVVVAPKKRGRPRKNA